ncbi:MAG: hypothetical protein ACRERD_28755 [Candidatus Binatia bacterium]
MIICKGRVKENIVVLEEGVCLPDGAAVEVRLVAPPFIRDKAFARVLPNRILSSVNMEEILEEDKKEREEHADRWLKP